MNNNRRQRLLNNIGKADFARNYDAYVDYALGRSERIYHVLENEGHTRHSIKPKLAYARKLILEYGY